MEPKTTPAGTTVVEHYASAVAAPGAGLQAGYYARAVKHALEHQLNLPELVVDGLRWCRHCHRFFVPGVTMHMRVVFGRGRSKGGEYRARSRKAVLRCIPCGRLTSFPLPVGTARRAQQSPAGPTKPEAPAGLDKPAELDKQPSTTSRKRKKKSLSSLLADKRAADAAAQRKQSLSLFP